MRFITAVATSLTLLIALPAAAAAPKAAAPSSGTRYAADSGFDLANATIAGWVGGEFGDLDGFSLRADGSLPIMKLSPSIDLLGVAQVGFVHFGADIPYGTISWNMLKVTAAARFQMPVTPEFDAFADAGLGFYFGKWTQDVTLPILGTFKTDDTTGGGQMRFAIGGLYKLNAQTKIGVDLGFNPYFGDAETTNFFINAGVQYKL